MKKPTKNDFYVQAFIAMLEAAYKALDMLDESEFKYDVKKAFNQNKKASHEFYRMFERKKNIKIKAIENGK